MWWASYSAVQETIWRGLYHAGADVGDDDWAVIVAVQAVSALVGGSISGGLTTPLDVVKTQLQARHSPPRAYFYSVFLHAAACICAWVVASKRRPLPFCTDMYDQDAQISRELEEVEVVVMGVLQLSAHLKQPASLTRALRLQVAGQHRATANLTTWKVVQQVYAKEGLIGFWRGALPRMSSVALWGTCMATAYESLKRVCVIDDTPTQ